MVKSWKTTLGGSLSATGTLLMGTPIAISATKITVPDNVFVACVLIGMGLLAAGTFFNGLFGRDNDVPSEAVKSASDTANKIRNDTTIITKP